MAYHKEGSYQAWLRGQHSEAMKLGFGFTWVLLSLLAGESPPCRGPSGSAVPHQAAHHPCPGLLHILPSALLSIRPWALPACSPPAPLPSPHSRA